jgi:hypothetical protein
MANAQGAERIEEGTNTVSETEYRFTVHYLYTNTYHFCQFRTYFEANEFFARLAADPECRYADLTETVVHRRVDRMGIEETVG